MAVIPSFDAYPQTPDAGSAFVGGYRASSDALVRQQAIAADAAQAAARIALGREQIAAEATQSLMQLEARKEFVASQAMKQAQEAEIEKSYREAQLGMQERALKNDEAITGMRLQEAAQGFEASQNFNRIYQMELASGKSEAEAQRTAARAVGPAMTGFASAIEGGNSKTGTATERSLLYQHLNAEEGRIRNKYPKTRNPNFTPGDRAALDELNRRRAEMFPMEAPTTGAAPPTSPMTPPQWQVDPNTLPYGAPKNPSWFIGTPPPRQIRILGVHEQ